MLDFGKHTAFVLWTYGLSIFGIIGLIAYVYLRGRK